MIYKLIEAGDVQVSQYKGKDQYKQWVTAENGFEEKRILLTLKNSTPLVPNCQVDIEYGEERTAKNGKPYCFGSVIGGVIPAKIYTKKPSNSPTIGAQSDNSANTRDISIEKQVCFKGAIELACAGLLKPDAVISETLNFCQYIFGHKPEDIPSPVEEEVDEEEAPKEPLPDDDFDSDDIPF